MMNEIGIKTDCKFFKTKNSKEGCSALKKLYCKIENKLCKFYKPRGKGAKI